MDQAKPIPSAKNTACLVRDLLEEIAGKTEELRLCIESIQDLAGEMTSDPAAGLHRSSLMRLQILDSLCQRLAALPELVRSLKAAVPAELRVEDVETFRAFSVAMRSYQGAAVSSRPESSVGAGDCEIWKT